MLANFWNASYEITLPTNLVVGMMCVLVALLFFWRLISWRDKHEGTSLRETPWIVWFPLYVSAAWAVMFCGYGVIELI